jgi:ribosomal protein L7/L12
MRFDIMSISRKSDPVHREHDVLELSEFVKELEDKFGVQAAMPMMAAAPGAAAGAAPAAEARKRRPSSTLP